MRLRECIISAVGPSTSCYEAIAWKDAAVTYVLARLLETVLKEYWSVCRDMTVPNVEACLAYISFS